MGLSVFDQVPHPKTQHLISNPLRQREHMFRGIFFFLVDAPALDAYGVDEQREKLW